MKASEYIGSMFINVCYNFTPFLSQVTSFMVKAQPGLPGAFTVFGGASLFIGCTLLAMSYQDQQEMAHIPLIDMGEELQPQPPAQHQPEVPPQQNPQEKKEEEAKLLPEEVLNPPNVPGYAKQELS